MMQATAFRTTTLALITTAVCASIPRATAAQSAAALAITGGRIIDGTGTAPIEHGTIVVSGDRIVAVGPATDVVVPRGARVIDATGLTLLPGLIDSHVHLGAIGLSKPGGNVPDELPRFLEHGVTSVKDLGDPHPWTVQLKRDQAEGRLAGPRLFVAGPMFTAPGGHPAGTFFKTQEYARVHGAREVKDAASARAMVRALHAEGVDVIKAVYDHGHEESPFGILPKLQRDVLAAVIDEAHRNATRVTVHWGQAADLADVIAMNPDALEHGGFEGITPAAEAAIRARTKPLYVVPTITAIAQYLPPEILELVTLSNVRRFAAAGAVIVAGTDAPLGSEFGAGMHRELELLVASGLTPMQALQAATLRGAELLGKAHELGTLERGKLADIIAVAGDPLADIRHARNVRLVLLGGKVVVENKQ